MNAVLKGIWSYEPDISLDSYSPENPKNFSMWLELKIGQDDSVGADDFRLFVCTPEWLKNNSKAPLFGRHVLIVYKYDIDVIKYEIERCIESCIAPSWILTAQKLSRFFAWEFEDYQP
jgi:Immunity protein 8